MKNNINIDSTISAVIVISEKSCLNCNIAFSEFSNKYIYNPKVKYIISAEGGLFDTRQFEKSKGVFFDNNNAIHTNKIIESSGVIFLNYNLKIDTIVDIKTYNVNETIQYIESRLE